MSTSDLANVLDAFERLDWSDAANFGPAVEPMLRAWSGDRAFLRDRLAAVAKGEGLARCEWRPGIDKLVLGESPSGQVRLRMHVYRGGLGEGGSIPHSHRWSFTSIILRGTLRHVIFNDEPKRQAGPRALFVQLQPAGTLYSLEGDAIHSAAAEPGTVTLFVRGPGAKAKATFVDPISGRRRQRAGEDEEKAAGEGPEAPIIAWSKMSADRVVAVEVELARLQVL